MTPAVAELAGATSQGNGLQVYDVDDADTRLGVLSHPGFLAALGTTSFVGRGLFLTERLLCQKIAPPPDDATGDIMDAAMATEHMTPREASEFRFQLDPLCQSCHFQFEPVAYAFERYDMSGRFTLTDEEGRDLYSDGSLPAHKDRPKIDFDDAPELMASLAEQDQIQRCIVENMIQFATGFSTAGSVASIDSAFDDYTNHGSTFDALVGAVSRNPRLQHKLPATQ